MLVVYKMFSSKRTKTKNSFKEIHVFFMKKLELVAVHIVLVNFMKDILCIVLFCNFNEFYIINDSSIFVKTYFLIMKNTVSHIYKIKEGGNKRVVRKEKRSSFFLINFSEHEMGF